MMDNSDERKFLSDVNRKLLTGDQEPTERLMLF